MTLSEFASLLAIIFGLTGAILGALSYFRDKAKILITLQWDMKITNNPEYDENKFWGFVKVTNIGRRPIFISSVALALPKKYDYVFILFESIGGKKLGEGDPPATYFINQEGLEKYAKDWKKIRAQVKESTGKIYSSRKIKKIKIPSWVK